MDNHLTGHIAVVTGASRGIGRAISLAFANAGASVVLAARNSADLNHLKNEIEASGGSALAVPTDISNDDDVRNLVHQTEMTFGRATLVVNNAGAHVVGKFLDLPMEEFERLMDLNYYSVVRITKGFLPTMVDEGRGSIINIASTAGKAGTALQTPYNASKHAVLGLTRSLALELGTTGIRVNAICPGFVETDLIQEAVGEFAIATGVEPEDASSALLSRVPIGRLLHPDEIASLALYLAGDESSGMTGQALTISGGLQTF